MSLKPANYEDYASMVDKLVHHLHQYKFPVETQKAIFWAIYALFHKDFEGEVGYSKGSGKFARESIWEWRIEEAILPLYDNIELPYEFILKFDRSPAAQSMVQIWKWKGVQVKVYTKGISFVVEACLLEKLSG